MDAYTDGMIAKEFRYVSYAVSNGSIGNYTKAYETWKRARNIIECFIRETKSLAGPITVVDIGCANGLYIFLLNKIFGTSRKAYFYGIDISDSEIRYAEELRKRFGIDNIKFEVGNAADIKLPDNSIDLVTCAELIEHIADPRDCLAGIHRILKSNGLAIITTPNKDNCIVKIKNMFLFSKHHNSVGPYEIGLPNMPFDHVSVKGTSEWTSIMKDCGFRVAAIRRGSLICGGPKYDSHPILFALSMMVDIALDHIPFTTNFTENVTFELRKVSRQKRCS